MVNNSIWLKDTKTKLEKKLEKDTSVDVLIIGAGLTGISTAFYLKDSKKNIAVVDSNRIGHGVTSKTTGKITYLQGLVYSKIQNVYNTDTANKYLKSQKYAMELIKQNILNYNIMCNYDTNSSYIFTNSNCDISKIKSEACFLKKAGAEYKTRDNIEIKFPSVFSLKVNDTAVFHPLKYLLALKDICKDKGINFYEKTPITELVKKEDYYLARSNKYTIKAKKVILACHYPFFLKPNFFPLKVGIEKSYVAAGIIPKNRKFNAISIGKDLHSIRYHTDKKNYIIYGGIKRSLGCNIDNEKNYKEHIWNMKTNLSSDLKYYWLNYDIVTPDSMPIIGYYEKSNPNLLIGTGYNAWGMTNATLAGKILSDIILEKENEYIDLFDPYRKTNLNKIINQIGFALENTCSLISSKIKTKYDFYPKNVKIIRKDGVKYGVYTDEEKKEHIVYNTCPHMKCGLIFNTVEKTWDCPCHGSRFDIKGNSIKGPSVYSIKVR